MRRSSSTTAARPSLRDGSTGFSKYMGAQDVLMLDGNMKMWRKGRKPVTKDAAGDHAGRVRRCAGGVDLRFDRLREVPSRQSGFRSGRRQIGRRVYRQEGGDEAEGTYPRLDPPGLCGSLERGRHAEVEGRPGEGLFRSRGHARTRTWSSIAKQVCARESSSWP